MCDRGLIQKPALFKVADILPEDATYQHLTIMRVPARKCGKPLLRPALLRALTCHSLRIILERIYWLAAEIHIQRQQET